MAKKVCYKCGKEIEYSTDEDCWNKSFHVPFDTLLKIKSIVKDNCICTECMQESRNEIIKQMQRNTLKKDEILSLRDIIADTFEKRNSFVVFPFKIVYNETSLPTKQPVQVLFTVPKRNFKLAVKRNLLRRRIKEAYRKNKHSFYQFLQDNNKQMAVVIIYIARKELSYQEIEEKIILSLQKIPKIINK
jgi:ribonuclease P protein component